MVAYLLPAPISQPAPAVQVLGANIDNRQVYYPSNAATIGQVWPEYLEPTP